VSILLLSEVNMHFEGFCFFVLFFIKKEKAEVVRPSTSPLARTVLDARYPKSRYYLPRPVRYTT
jgi:hypothetical protein